MKRMAGLLTLAFVLSSCKTRSHVSELKEIWLGFLDPKGRGLSELVERNEFVTLWSQLPREGAAEHQPWSSPTSIDLPVASAAAAILFAEPAAVKSPQGRAYTSLEIKEQLIRFLHNHSSAENGVETRSLGGACRLDSETYRTLLLNQTYEEREDECFAVQAAAFHLTLANIIGLRHESFALDPAADQRSEFLPVIDYKSRLITDSVSPDGGRRLLLETTVRMADRVAATSKKEPVHTRERSYRYQLELDSEGEIINGDWLGSDRPEVAWMQNRPRFPADETGLEDLYTRSAGLPDRMKIRDFSVIDTEDQRLPQDPARPLLSNLKYRLEIKGAAPRGADGLKAFLSRALRPLGPSSIYRNTFADEDSFVSIEVQFHQQVTEAQVAESLIAHSQDQVNLVRILRP